MISYIQIGEKQIGFKTSILAIQHYACGKGIKFEEAINGFLKKMDFEEYFKIFHSSICTIEGQEEIKESDIWKWVDDDITLMQKLINAMMETLPKNLASPGKQTGQ
jgi:hypothetical protein